MYLNILPKGIADELRMQESLFSSSLLSFKFWCYFRILFNNSVKATVAKVEFSKYFRFSIRIIGYRLVNVVLFRICQPLPRADRVFSGFGYTLHGSYLSLLSSSYLFLVVDCSKEKDSSNEPTNVLQKTANYFQTGVE